MCKWRTTFLFLLVVFICIMSYIRYPIEGLIVKDPSTVQDGSCWCCGCGWQSCKTCAANAAKCCPSMMSFERWNFGKGGSAVSDDREARLDLISNNGGDILADAAKITAESGGKLDLASDAIQPGSFEQRQALLNALEKAGIQPQSVTADQIALMLKEMDLGGIKC